MFARFEKWFRQADAESDSVGTAWVSCGREPMTGTNQRRYRKQHCCHGHDSPIGSPIGIQGTTTGHSGLRLTRYRASTVDNEVYILDLQVRGIAEQGTVASTIISTRPMLGRRLGFVFGQC
jgi:hypothetical protein